MKNKKITLVTPYFYPEKTGIGRTSTQLAEVLKEYGHDISVVTDFPHLPNWRKSPADRAQLFRQDSYKGILINRVWQYLPKHEGLFGRMLYELTFSVLVIFRLLTRRSDLYICILPYTLTAFFVSILCKVLRKPLWIYIKDLELNIAIELGLVKSNFLITLVKKLEAYLYRNSSKIFALTEEIKKYVLSVCPQHQEVHLLPSWIELQDMLSAVQSKSFFEKEHQLNAAFIVLYSGSLSVKYDYESMIAAAKLLEEERDICLAIVCDGPSSLKNDLESLIQRTQLKNVKILPLSEESQFPDMLASASLAILPEVKSKGSNNFPSKINHYLAAGLPVLSIADEENHVTQLIKDNNLGTVVSNTPSLIAAEIQRLKANPDLLKQVQGNALSYAQEAFDISVSKTKYLDQHFATTPSRYRNSQVL